MKKLIFSLIAGVAMIAGTSVQTQACSGTVYICPSQVQQFIEEALDCPDGSQVTAIMLSAEDCGEN